MCLTTDLTTSRIFFAFLNLIFPGVAQLVGRLVWEIDRVSQTCYNSKCKTRWNTKQIRINLTQF